MSFLGHHLQLINGKLRVTVSHASAAKFSATLAELDEKMSFAYGPIDSLSGPHTPKASMKPGGTIKVLSEMRQYVRSWCAAFAQAEDVAEFRAFAEYALHDHMKALGINHKQLDITVAKHGVHRHFDEYHLG